jgi:uncharacterized protein YcbX
MEGTQRATDFRLHSVWRYPVKSLGGEQLQIGDVTRAGLLGDRSYAFVDARNKVGTAKRRPQLLQLQAEFLEPPQLGDHVPPVTITMPGGRKLRSNLDDVGEIVSTELSHPMTLAAKAPPELMLEFDAGTLSGKYAATTEMPVAGAAARGTFFDYGALHLLTTSTLRRLSEAYPQGRFDIRRFRPNLIIETDASGFVENSWIGHALSLGDEVVVKITIPCPRCVMPTLPQGDLPRDPGIMRVAAELNRHNLGEFGQLPCIGVYADVVRPGRVRPGDTVRLADEQTVSRKIVDSGY